MYKFWSRNKIISMVSLSIFICAAICVYAIEASIGQIKVTQDYVYKGMKGIYIQVYDVNAYNMKGKRIEFSGAISQDAKWINDLTIKIEPQLVQYTHSVWKGPSIWFFYSYDELKKRKCDTSKQFWFTIFVTNLDGNSNDYIRKDAAIKLNLGTTTTPPGDDKILDNKTLKEPEFKEEGDVNTECYNKCIQDNLMRSVSKEQIESDCRADCTNKK